jgi:hypothetical protein
MLLTVLRDSASVIPCLSLIERRCVATTYCDTLRSNLVFLLKKQSLSAHLFFYTFLYASCPEFSNLRLNVNFQVTQEQGVSIPISSKEEIICERPGSEVPDAGE